MPYAGLVVDLDRGVPRDALTGPDLDATLARLLGSDALTRFVTGMLEVDVHDPAVADDLAAAGALTGLPAFRRLRTALAGPVATFVALVHEVAAALDLEGAPAWDTLAHRLLVHPLGATSTLDALRAAGNGAHWTEVGERLARTDPHAVHPTSGYRWSEGHVVASSDDTVVEATTTSRTSTSVRVVDDVLAPEQRLLRDVYAPLGRCVAVVDSNVALHHGTRLATYFEHHGIELVVRVQRAMEVDKGIGTVEQLLGWFKQERVARTEPVLVVGGGVLADVAGLACALYHRSTPYVMLSTSLVAGIDAGPSPRTCSDGFGYKNLFGAYHPPVLSITDPTFFATLREGWLRHGVAEIAKMAITTDAALVTALEDVGPALVRSRFGAVHTGDAATDAALGSASRQVLGGALRGYVAAEFGNLYETHQARPHAYGHTWSPGFEIPAGLLHGHAVSIGMGFGAVLAGRLGWLPEPDVRRVLDLLSRFGLALWHDTLDDHDLVWDAQQRMEQKRGGRLAAPLPHGAVGSWRLLERLERPALDAALDEYATVVRDWPRRGRGIEPLCSDVGLEDPSTVAGTAPVPADDDILLDLDDATPWAVA